MRCCEWKKWWVVEQWVEEQWVKQWVKQVVKQVVQIESLLCSR